MKLNIKAICSTLGILLVINGLFMLLCIPFTLYYSNEIDFFAILTAGLTTITSGLFLWLPFYNKVYQGIKKRDGYLIVTLGWLVMSLSGTLPYMFSGAIPNFTDAFFETMSGYTTTGASTLDNIESITKDILFWRSLTQWIGGMGIIVLAVAVLPLLGIGGMQLFVAEAPGISTDKLQPRIKETAKRLWLIYVGLTFIITLLLYFGGMSFFDAINHSLTTVATGGFSTKQASIAHYNSSFIEMVIILGMFVAGVNYTLTYYALKLKFKKVWISDEFKFYVLLIVVFTTVIGFSVYNRTELGLERSFRDSLFMVVSVITTTGFVTADYTIWGPAVSVLFLLFMFFGGCAGSTSGSVKIVRHIILLKNSFLDLKRQLHPSAIIPVRLNGKAVDQSITYNVLAFIILYIMVFCISTFLFSLSGVDILTSAGAVATTLGNVGPGLGTVGPVFSFSHISVAGKWFLSFLMLIGRLELFTVLILFTSYFWRQQ